MRRLVAGTLKRPCGDGTYPIQNAYLIMKTDLTSQETAVQSVSVSGEELAQLIAQKPPMVMIDKLVSVSDHFSETRYSVPEGGIFSDDGQLSEAGLVENMAQTIGVGSGFSRRRKGKELLTGFMTMIKNLKIERLPDCGSEIRTEVRFQYQALNFRIFSGKVFSNNQQIAECEIRVYSPDQEELT